MEIVAQQEEKLIRDYPKMSHPIVWIAGEDLSNLVKKYNPQFIWGVLSAFDKSINIDINNLLVGLCKWKRRALGTKSKYSAPSSKIEIVCWDSSLMLLLSNDINIDDKFRNYFKEARDLNAYNSEF